jgi:type II secretory pathway pseudopilin PulG
MEMLIVIVILAAITSVMIPVMVSASDSRRIREAARLVNTMLSSAQSRAIASGRSVGVLFQPIRNKQGASVNPMAAMDLYLVESPPPYAGDTASSVVKLKVMKVTIATAAGPQPAWDATITPNFPADYGWTLVRPGDLIRFNFRGETFALDPGDQNANVPLPRPPIPLTIIPTDKSRVVYDKKQNPHLTDPTVLPALATGPGGVNVSFQVFRQPVKTMDPPVQLSDGAAVDLYFSGIDIAPLGTNPPTACVLGSLVNGTAANFPPCIVTFSQDGRVDQAYFGASRTGGSPMNMQVRPLTGVYILVGKVDRIPNTEIPNPLNFSGPNEPPPNYLDPDCRWVSVTRQSGLVTTTETVRVNNPAAISGTLNPQNVQDIMTSRRYATSNQASSGQ